MLSCDDMKKGDIFTCEDCGLEFQVISECDVCGGEEKECGPDTCSFSCCGKDLVKK